MRCACSSAQEAQQFAGQCSIAIELCIDTADGIIMRTLPGQMEKRFSGIFVFSIIVTISSFLRILYCADVAFCRNFCEIDYVGIEIAELALTVSI